MTDVIEVSGLRKEYRRLARPTTIAVDGLDLAVPEGGVFGFLGPNGSGKTTTIRCLLGLAAPSAGSCRLLGVDTRRRLASVITKVGSIVESPVLYPAFSGRRNLRLLGAVYGIGSKKIDDALERVDLSQRADDLVKTYSLGMRQRLGIAAALLKDPAVLILDEPANGLDPAGIVDVRRLLRQMGDEGRTVFVSSHILNEIEQTCDRVAILSRGKCVAAGEVQDVLRAKGSRRLIVKVGDLPRATDVLRNAGFDAQIEGDTLSVNADPIHAAKVSETLARAELFVTELRPQEISLEDVFLQLTGVPHDPEASR